MPGYRNASLTKGFCAGLITLLFVTLTHAETPQQDTKPVNPMRDFGMTASNVFFYYADLDRATHFYTQTLGLTLVADYGMAKILRVAPTSYLTLVDGRKGMHRPEEPKTVAIALVTDQLEGWWAYIQKQGVPVKFPFAPKEGRPHHGFVAIDPEGYLLEFERFNTHEENTKLMPRLNNTATLYPEMGKSDVPPGLGFNATVIWFYYKDMVGIQKFYEEVMGFDLIVDQGWAKVYPLSPSGYFGLVDEQRGMHKFTEQKAVTMSFLTDRVDDWYTYLSTNKAVKMRSQKMEESNPRYRAFLGYDPEGYYLEFDVFLDHSDNTRLMEALTSGMKK